MGEAEGLGGQGEEQDREQDGVAIPWLAIEDAEDECSEQGEAYDAVGEEERGDPGMEFFGAGPCAEAVESALPRTEDEVFGVIDDTVIAAAFDGIVIFLTDGF